MKIQALEDISCRYGSKEGFGTKLKGEIFEVSDERGLEIIALGGAVEVKDEVVQTKEAKATK
mgnify:CR=1 FL=1